MNVFNLYMLHSFLFTTLSLLCPLSCCSSPAIHIVRMFLSVSVSFLIGIFLLYQIWIHPSILVSFYVFLRPLVSVLSLRITRDFIFTIITAIPHPCYNILHALDTRTSDLYLFNSAVHCSLVWHFHYRKTLLSIKNSMDINVEASLIYVSCFSSLAQYREIKSE